jgi:G3E family GTPase
VIGGYLGAGKTTLLNQLLRNPGGRRLGVIVNDFGELGIDADRLAGASEGLVNLPNGCVCCTLGEDLGSALGAMSGSRSALDQIVIEASGVAEPRAIAAWSTVPPFEPGGVVVVAAADSVRRRARDRYVGGEVVRQLEGADLIVVSRADRLEPADFAAVREWCTATSGGAPTLGAEFGALPADVVLGVRPRAGPGTLGNDGHGHERHGHVSYWRWAWESEQRVTRGDVTDFLARVPATVLRLKGEVALSDGSGLVVDVVGRSVETRRRARGTRSRLEAIGIGVEPELAPPGAGP